MAAYSTVLKKCLEEALCDRFVCGFRNKQTQKRLSAEKALTWKTAVEIALAMEAADKQANNFRNPPEDTSVNYVKQPHLQKATKQRKPCFHCGKDHIPQKCPFKHEDCRSCNSKGHIAKVCKKKAPTSRPKQNWRKQPVRYLELDDSAPNNHDDEFKLFQISEEKPEPSIMIPVKVNSEECSMELDTGATVSIMSEEA